MATGSAGDGFLFRSASLSGSDPVASRRPYHKNCKCSLHGKNGGKSCSDRNCSRKVSYPIRRSWSESCLVVAAPSPSGGSTTPSPSLSPSFSALNMADLGGGTGRCAGLPPVPDRRRDDDGDDLFFVSRV